NFVYFAADVWQTKRFASATECVREKALSSLFPTGEPLCSNRRRRVLEWPLRKSTDSVPSVAWLTQAADNGADGENGSHRATSQRRPLFGTFRCRTSTTSPSAPGCRWPPSR